jgi:hypothetical protein
VLVVYARRSWRFAAQVTSDIFVLVWTITWGLLGSLVNQAVSAAADPARETSSAVRRVSADFQAAAEKASTVPGIGDQLRLPFESAVRRLGAVGDSADRQVALIEHAAVALGWLTFAIPVLVVIVAWLPRRIRFVQQARAAQQFLDARADLDLFALRAMATQPMHVLARISDDPVGAWRSGDRAVIDALADLELRRSGLRLSLDGPVSPPDPQTPDDPG